ncbi:hypothetical protein Q7P37_002392 [Cladosporium fusiforme]
MAESKDNTPSEQHLASTPKMQDTTNSDDVDMVDAPPSSMTMSHNSMNAPNHPNTMYEATVPSEGDVVPSIEVTKTDGTVLPVPFHLLDRGAFPARRPTISPILSAPKHLNTMNKATVPSEDDVVPSIEVTRTDGTVLSVPFHLLDGGAFPARKPTFSLISPPPQTLPRAQHLPTAELQSQDRAIDPVTRKKTSVRRSPPKSDRVLRPRGISKASQAKKPASRLSPKASGSQAKTPPSPTFERTTSNNSPNSTASQVHPTPSPTSEKPTDWFEFKGLPSSVKNKIYAMVFGNILVHQRPVELHRKPFFRRLTESQKPHIVTVGMGKSVRRPEDRYIVPRGLNTNDPTNLFLVSREFKKFGMEIYYGENDFIFSSFADLDAWAENIQHRRHFVQHLTLRSTWEVGFTDTNVRQEMLRMDHLSGLMITPTIHRFPNLETIKLDIRCIEQWKRPSFPKYPNISSGVVMLSQYFARDACERLLRFFGDTQLEGKKIETTIGMSFVNPPPGDYYKTFDFIKGQKPVVRKRVMPVFHGQVPTLTNIIP